MGIITNAITYIPEHLNKNNMPWISDILYHPKLVYTYPTGFTPEEYKFVIELFDQLTKRKIKMPPNFWRMLPNYFNLTKEFIDASKTLSPLLNKKISFALLIYDRDINKLEKTKEIFINDDKIYKYLSQVKLDFRLLDREFLSHIWHASFEFENFDKINYIKKITANSEEFLINFYSLFINKLLYLISLPIDKAIQNNSWWPLLGYLEKYTIENRQIQNNFESNKFTVERIKYRLFFELTSPIFGICNNIAKAIYTNELIENKIEEIDELKNVCESISFELMKINYNNSGLIQALLMHELKKKVLNPLSDLTKQTKQKIEKLFKSFLLDSSIIGTLVTALNNTITLETIGITASAGLLSSLGNTFLNTNDNYTLPSKFISKQLKKIKLEQKDYIGIIENISSNSIIIK